MKIKNDNQKTGGRVFKGTVVKTAMKNTATVKVFRLIKHSKYKKYVEVSKKYLVHDVGNTAKVGDIVLIKETRPISKLKNFVLHGTISSSVAENDQ